MGKIVEWDERNIHSMISFCENKLYLKITYVCHHVWGWQKWRSIEMKWLLTVLESLGCGGELEDRKSRNGDKSEGMWKGKAHLSVYRHLSISFISLSSVCLASLVVLKHVLILRTLIKGGRKKREKAFLKCCFLFCSVAYITTVSVFLLRTHLIIKNTISFHSLEMMI